MLVTKTMSELVTKTKSELVTKTKSEVSAGYKTESSHWWSQQTFIARIGDGHPPCQNQASNERERQLCGHTCLAERLFLEETTCICVWNNS